MTIDGLTLSGEQAADYVLTPPTTTANITAATTTTTVTSSDNPSNAGQSVTFTATVSADDPEAGTPTGSVQFMIDGSDYGDPVTLGDDGTASISDAALDASGSPHSVSAVYTNLNGNYAGSPGDLIGGQVVNPAMTVYVDASYAATRRHAGHLDRRERAHYFDVDAFDTIQGGVDAVADGGTVDVAPGTYSEAVTIADDVTLAGAGQNPSARVLDGIECGLLRHHHCSRRRDHLGSGDPGFLRRGRIDFAGGFATLSDDTIADNGTGVLIEAAGTATVNGCTLSDNASSDSGGGIDNAGTVTVTNCTLSDNTASDGGGIENDGTLTMTGTTLSGNLAQDDGGGIENDGTLTVTNCTISGNSAQDDGGGIDNNGTLTLTGGTISGNWPNTTAATSRTMPRSRSPAATPPAITSKRPAAPPWTATRSPRPTASISRGISHRSREDRRRCDQCRTG